MSCRRCKEVTLTRTTANAGKVHAFIRTCLGCPVDCLAQVTLASLPDVDKEQHDEDAKCHFGYPCGLLFHRRCEYVWEERQARKWRLSFGFRKGRAKATTKNDDQTDRHHVRHCCWRSQLCDLLPPTTLSSYNVVGIFCQCDAMKTGRVSFQASSNEVLGVCDPILRKKTRRACQIQNPSP